MEIDAKNDLLLVEIRNNEDRSVYFASVELRSGKAYFKYLTTPERWLTGIE